MPGTLRRGLPRVPGGEPWPPGSDGASAPAPDLPGAETGPQARAAVPPATGPMLRRGLPRQAGGDPWPPAGAAPASGPSASDRGPEAAGVDDPGSSEREPSPAGPAGADASPAAAANDRFRSRRALPDAGATTTRRGLPRTPGGDRWPPAGTIVAVWAPPARGEDAASPERSPRSLPPSQAAGADDLPPAPLAVAAAAGPRPPLPFTPTVWPGAAASGPRGPRPEPRRYGPFTRLQWAGAVGVAGAGLLVAAGMAVALVRWWLSTEWGAGFLSAYPGEYHLPEGAPVGFPAWLGWQHFFNAFLIVLIIRSGLQVRREKRPTVFWSPRGDRKRRISLALWFHQSLDILWLANGVVFVVLLFWTGQWMRIVPTSWEVFPNAVSAALQYVSLDWPTENGWVNYNSLQQLTYFTTVFVAAPLATVTGVRMSGVWPRNAATLNRLYPLEWARRIHFPVMIYFVLFIIAHVALVFATGALRNLNHMYAAQDAVNWTGFWVFVASVAVTIAAWVAARPLLLAPIARLFGDVKSR